MAKIMSENEINTIITTNEARCPYCHSRDIEYEGDDRKHDCIFYYFTCNKCGCESAEVNKIEFLKTEGNATKEQYLKNVFLVISYFFFFRR